MHRDQKFSLPTPDALLGEMVDRIAVAVLARLEGVIKRAEYHQSLTCSYQEEKPLPTFLRMNDLVERIGLSRGHLYQRMAAGTFPASIKLGMRTADWRREDIEAWEQDPGSWKDTGGSVLDP